MKFKKNVKLFILLVLIIACSIIGNKVLAQTYIINLNSNKNQVAKEEVFEITLSVNSKEGIGVYYTKIEYDESKFELVNAKGLDKWDTPTINNGELIATTIDGELVAGEQKLAIITFKAKEDVKDIESIVKATDFKTSNTEEVVIAETTEVKIGNINTSGNEKNNNTTNNITNNTINDRQDNTTDNSKENNKKDNTIIGSILPKTGKELALRIIPATIILGIAFGIVIYIRKKL